MISQKADTARNQAFEGRPFIRLAYSILVGKGKSQKLARTKNIDYEEIDKKSNLRYAVKNPGKAHFIEIQKAKCFGFRIVILSEDHREV